jgi:hypothetical protein
MEFYTAEEAEKVLTTLLNYKIDYHNREFQQPHSVLASSILKKRIQELNSTKDDIKKNDSRIEKKEASILKYKHNHPFREIICLQEKASCYQHQKEMTIAPILEKAVKCYN